MTKTNSQIVNDMFGVIDDATVHGLWEYQEVTVENHFKPGNQRRYKWPAVSREYYLRKVKSGYPPQQLVRSGILKDSVVGQGQVVKKPKSEFEIVFSKVPEYGNYQKTGAPPQKGPRDFLKPDELDKMEVENHAQQYIDKYGTTLRRIDPRTHI